MLGRCVFFRSRDALQVEPTSHLREAQVDRASARAVRRKIAGSHGRSKTSWCKPELACCSMEAYQR